MPTFYDPGADAGEAYEALRGLAHASRRFEHPKDMYGVVGDLLGGVRALRQVLDQLATAYASNRPLAFDDNGDHSAGSKDALAAADELHQAASFIDQAEERLNAAMSVAGRIAWHSEPSDSLVSVQRWISVCFLQGDDADELLQMIDAQKSAADATQVHDHYLKGTVYCGQCGERLIITNAKNRHGNVYPYFVCSGRHSGKTECTRQAILIEDVERLIEKYYEMIEVSPGMRQDLAGKIHADFDLLMANETKELSRLTSERDRLDDERMKLLQAHYAGAVPIDLLKQEQDRIADQIGDIQHRIEAHHDEYASARANLDDSLGLLANIVSVYEG